MTQNESGADLLGAKEASLEMACTQKRVNPCSLSTYAGRLLLQTFCLLGGDGMQGHVSVIFVPIQSGVWRLGDFLMHGTPSLSLRSVTSTARSWFRHECLSILWILACSTAFSVPQQFRGNPSTKGPFQSWIDRVIPFPSHTLQAFFLSSSFDGVG